MLDQDTASTLNLRAIENMEVNRCTKGVPGHVDALQIGDIGAQGWNLLRGDLPLPAAVLKESGLAHNSAWMVAFLKWKGAVICPHGKTTMAPQLFQRQLDDGAWGMTAATAGQIQTYRQFGVARILMANQLVDPKGLEFILGELKRDPAFDFYCLVDSAANAQWLADAVKAADIGRPLQVLLEVGCHQGRTGVRGKTEGVALARKVRSLSPYLSLRGVEAFEGVFSISATESAETKVTNFLEDMRGIILQCLTENLFAPGPVYVTAGGSAYFDMVTEVLTEFGSAPTVLILRSGCYLTHDAGLYKRSMIDMAQRMPDIKTLGQPPVSALEVWGYVQSLPEPGQAIVTFGKRDVSFDIEMPVVNSWYRPGVHQKPELLDSRYGISKLNDQHAYMTLPENHTLAIGDMVSVGVSHPCTTFDKWQLLYLVNDDYDIVGGIRTFF